MVDNTGIRVFFPEFYTKNKAIYCMIMRMPCYQLSYVAVSLCMTHNSAGPDCATMPASDDTSLGLSSGLKYVSCMHCDEADSGQVPLSRQDFSARLTNFSTPKH
jgi:hypothetical protein